MTTGKIHTHDQRTTNAYDVGKRRKKRKVKGRLKAKKKPTRRRKK